MRFPTVTITEAVIPRVFDFVRKHTDSLFQDILVFSFTTEIWTSSVCPVTRNCFAAQWQVELQAKEHAHSTHTPPKL